MFFETMGNVSKIGLRHLLMALLHGVERCAQVRDRFTTRCSKERASRRFLKNQCIKLINSNMSLTFALFAPRKGTQSVERGEWMLFISKGVIDIIFLLTNSRKI